MCPSPLPMATLGEDAAVSLRCQTPTFPMPYPGAHGWYPRGAPQSQLAPGQALRKPRLQALQGWRGRACSGTPAAAPRAGRQVFRWLLPGQGPRARRPARVGGAPSATLGVGIPRHRGPLRRGRRRNPITAPRAGRASQGCSAAGDGRVPGAPSAPSAERSPSGGGGRPARTPRGAVASARRSARFAAAGPQVRRTQDAEEGQPREKAAASPAEPLRRHHLLRATPRPAPRVGKGRT